MASMVSMAHLTRTSEDERKRRETLAKWLRTNPIPDSELWMHLGLFINRQEMSRLLFIHDLYRMIIDVQGIVMEFGVRWGQHLALYSTFRGMYEPYNYTRKIVGFDTFEGFPDVHAKDGASPNVRKGAYSVSEGYEGYLEEILRYHESESPIPHLRKFELIKGDARVTVPKYLEEHPETVISLACFDIDLYEPTLACLKAILPRLVKGSVLWFDETNCPTFPGETLAVQEVLGLNNLKLCRSPHGGFASYVVWE
jgi:hypothetical protein